MEARSHTGKTAAHIMPCSGGADENMAEEKKKDKGRDEIERKRKVLTLHCSSLQPYDSTSAFVAAAALLSSAVYLIQALKQKTEATKMPQHHTLQRGSSGKARTIYRQAAQAQQRFLIEMSHFFIVGRQRGARLG
jgi:isochorismate hydrolase